MLDTSALPTVGRVDLSADIARLAPPGLTFETAEVAAALASTLPPTTHLPMASPVLQIDEDVTDDSGVGDVGVDADQLEGTAVDDGMCPVVQLADRRRDPLVPPGVLIRILSARLPSLDPPVAGIGATQMRILTALGQLRWQPRPGPHRRTPRAEREDRPHARRCPAR